LKIIIKKMALTPANSDSDRRYILRTDAQHRQNSGMFIVVYLTLSHVSATWLNYIRLQYNTNVMLLIQY
ncbi:hypothetical protein ACQP3J_31850, partial [Escherichia coli]